MTVRQELLDATDETIDDAVRFADPMVLRGLLYQLTGDESIAVATSFRIHDDAWSASTEKFGETP